MPKTLIRRYLSAACAALAGSVVFTASACAADPEPPAPPDSSAKPTVVLVHGAFADASSWNGVIAALQREGYPTIAPADPLRDVAGDAAYIASVVRSIPGPVLLVGHSYGGAIITNAARDAANARGLVYLAAFAPDTGESALGISQRFPETLIGKSLSPRIFPLPDGAAGTDLYVDPARFREVFAQDVPADRAATMAATQRPITETAFGGPSGDPAWKSLPSWYLVSTEDHAIHPDAQRFMAQRLGAKEIREVNSSHAVAVSNPDIAADLIRTAARSIA
ncbi:alpha/beta hydrolase [Nocardia sp. NPDC050710]|uniref:alpha/beta fold hydrolase n=1 Tax=Nocardia sp. NPDC050710 TaxID=3157220 RepID=UPI0033C3645D